MRALPAVPEEIDEAFGVLEHHAIRHGHLFPVALATLPFLFARCAVARRRRAHHRAHRAVRRRVDARARAARAFLDLIVPITPARSFAGSATHDRALVRDRDARVRAARPICAPRSSTAETFAPVVLLALVDLGESARAAQLLALAMLDAETTRRACVPPRSSRATASARRSCRRDRCRAATVGGGRAAQPSSGELWTPTVHAAAVAPKLFDAEVMFAGKKFVLVTRRHAARDAAVGERRRRARRQAAGRHHRARPAEARGPHRRQGRSA